jgi:TfoX/Sxy family transcriptional regulator of competence genes
MKLSRSDEASNNFFRSLLPNGNPRIKVRPMFGNLAGFVNGNMFAGLYGNDLFVRLPEGDQEELLKNQGASVFEPMKGRRMKGYIVVPKAWWTEPETIHEWISLSLAYAAMLPPKTKKKKEGKKK